MSELDFVAARQAMVDSQLRPQGVNNPAVIEAMRAIPRERFVPDDMRALAYVDRPLPIGEGRTLSSPAYVGLLLTALAPARGERALVVGGSTGYVAALLGAMGIEVSAHDIARGDAALAALGADFDLVVIDGAVESVSQALVERLADGGRLGTAIIDRGVTRLAVGRKASGVLGLQTLGDVAVPALAGSAQPRAFVF